MAAKLDDALAIAGAVHFAASRHLHQHGDANAEHDDSRDANQFLDPRSYANVRDAPLRGGHHVERNVSFEAMVQTQARTF